MERSNITHFFNKTSTLTSYQDHYRWVATGNNIILNVFAPKNGLFDSYNLYTNFFKIQSRRRPKKSYQWSTEFTMFWKRVAFRGKSFRVRNFRKKHKIILNFGYSHWTRLKLLPMWSFIKKKRQSYVWFTQDLNSYVALLRFLPTIRIYNKYTMRGLRFKQQSIVRRFGKISQHISSLH